MKKKNNKKNIKNWILKNAVLCLINYGYFKKLNFLAKVKSSNFLKIIEKFM